MSELTEAHISRLVEVFYERARQDPELAPVFAAAVGDWDHHLQIVRNFWSRALLGTDRYQGHPYPAHINLQIRREHFDRWLELFRQTARKELPEAAAKQAIHRAEHMAESFRAGLFPFDSLEKKH